MGTVIVTPPAEDPVTLPEFKIHARIDPKDDSEDPVIRIYLGAAIETFEKELRQQLITATYLYTRDDFIDEIEIPRPPLQAVTSIKYLDQDQVERTLDPSTYEVDTSVMPGRVRRAYGKFWPSYTKRAGAVRIEFRAGYGMAAEVPRIIREGIFLAAAHWFETREPVNVGNIVNTLPWTCDRIIKAHRVEMCF